MKESIVFTNEEWIETIHHEMIRAFTKSIIQLMNYLQENSGKTSLFENSIQLLQEMKVPCSNSKSPIIRILSLKEKTNMGRK